ncbi:cobalamin-binding protein [Candidatus Thorarchaeota archaeon]|nr:MAG: cobalamin-binding protein [Candidatus Thorarchaeota archaeon]
MSAAILKELEQSVIDSDPEGARKAAQKALDEEIPPLKAISEGLAKGVREVGARFERGEAFLVELVSAGGAMKAGMEVLLQDIQASKAEVETAGRVLMVTVEGDIHSIGKDIVATLLRANGFDVIDLGEDIPTDTVIDKIKEYEPDIVGLSALLTTTIPMQRGIIDAMKKAGIRDQAKVMVGGAPTTEEWAEKIGADGWAPNAQAAVEVAKKLLSNA